MHPGGAEGGGWVLVGGSWWVGWVLPVGWGGVGALGDFRFVQGRGGCTRGLGWVGLALARRRRQDLKSQKALKKDALWLLFAALHVGE